MYQCPVCNKQNPTLRCACGFDISCDYEGYPTLANLPFLIPFRNRKSTASEAPLQCIHCSGFSFRVYPAAAKLRCCNCGQEVPFEMTPSVSIEQRIILPKNLPGSCALATGEYHTVGLRSNGTVVATGLNIDGQCNTAQWTDIVAIAAGSTQTFGIQRDGRVVSTGGNGCGQCNTSTWTDITAIAAAKYHTLGLKCDGTVVTTGFQDERCNTSKWHDIVAIAAGNSHSVGLCRDGSVVAVGKNDDNQCSTAHWRNIVSIAAGSNITMGLTKDGTVVSTTPSIPGMFAYQTDITALSTFGFQIGALRKDGTVLYTGSLVAHYQADKQAHPATWKDITSISVGNGHIVGCTKDGSVFAFGSNRSGQCNVQNWRLK